MFYLPYVTLYFKTDLLLTSPTFLYLLSYTLTSASLMAYKKYEIHEGATIYDMQYWTTNMHIVYPRYSASTDFISTSGWVPVLCFICRNFPWNIAIWYLFIVSVLTPDPPFPTLTISLLHIMELSEEYSYGLRRGFIGLGVFWLKILLRWPSWQHSGVWECECAHMTFNRVISIVSII